MHMPGVRDTAAIVGISNNSRSNCTIGACKCRNIPFDYAQKIVKAATRSIKEAAQSVSHRNCACIAEGVVAAWSNYINYSLT